jgi:hypothetical protein
MNKVMKFSHKFMRSIKILFELFLAMIFMKIIGKKYKDDPFVLISLPIIYTAIIYIILKPGKSFKSVNESQDFDDEEDIHLLPNQ